MSRASTWCMHRPALVLLLATLTLAAGGFGVCHTKIDASPENYLTGSRAWTEYEKIDGEYDISEAVVVAFRELGGTVFDAETVGAVAALDRALSNLDGVQRVLSIASATALDRENEALDLTPLLPSGPITKDTAIKLATRIEHHPVYGQALVDGPHETTFVFIQLASEMKDSISRMELARQIRRLADTFATRSRTVHLAGSPMLKEALAGAIAHDLLIYIPLTVGILVLLLWFAFGELVAALVPLMVVLLATFSTLGAFAAFSIPVTLATAIVPSLVIVIGLAETVHFLSELRRQHARTFDREISLGAAIQATATPSLVACSTFAVALIALIPSTIQPVRQLGIAAAFGIAVVYVATMLLTPTLLRAFDFPRKRERPLRGAKWIGRQLAGIALGARRHLIPTIAIIGLLIGVVIAAATGVRLDQDFVAYLSADHRLKADLAIIDRTLGGVDGLEMILDGTSPGFFKQTAELERLERLGKRLEKSDGVHTAFSLADYLKIANAVMMDSPEGEGRLPDSPEAVAQLTVIDPTPFEAFTDAEMKQARLTLQIRSMPSAEVAALAARVRERSKGVLEGSGIQLRITGRPILFSRMLTQVASDVARRLSIGLFFAWIVLILGLGSVATSCVALIPVISTGMLTLAAMALLGHPLDVIGVSLSTLVLGLSLNHAVHLSSRYLGAREAGSPTTESALIYAATHGGHPILLVTILAIVGFALLGLSVFGATRDLARLGMLIATFTGLAHLLALPLLLTLSDWLENRHSEPLATRRSQPRAENARRTRTELTNPPLPSSAPARRPRTSL